MGNRLVGNVAILGAVLLRIANVYDKLFDEEQFAVLQVQPQWWSIVGNFFANNALLLKFCAEYDGDRPLLL